MYFLAVLLDLVTFYVYIDVLLDHFLDSYVISQEDFAG